MSPKKILSYVLLAVSVLLLFKIYLDSTYRTPPPVSESSSEMEYTGPLKLPVSYSLGTFDARFGISQEKFLQVAQEAKKMWEDAVGRELFLYSQDGEMKINLIFDSRQERLLDAKQARTKIDEGGKSFDSLQAEYDAKSRSLERFRLEYEGMAQEHQSHVSDYNAAVSRWNSGTSHTDAEYQDLQRRKKDLETEQDVVEKKRIELNSSGQELDAFGEHMNALAREFNLEVENFNGRFVRSRDFEKGLYDGKGIDIYEYEDEKDLKLALVHEFGHALGLGHVENPKAIMYHKLAVQDVNDIHLTSDDLDLLSTRFKR